MKTIDSYIIEKLHLTKDNKNLVTKDIDVNDIPDEHFQQINIPASEQAAPVKVSEKESVNSENSVTDENFHDSLENKKNDVLVLDDVPPVEHVGDINGVSPENQQVVQPVMPSVSIPASDIGAQQVIPPVGSVNVDPPNTVSVVVSSDQPMGQ